MYVRYYIETRKKKKKPETRPRLLTCKLFIYQNTTGLPSPHPQNRIPESVLTRFQKKIIHIHIFTALPLSQAPINEDG